MSGQLKEALPMSVIGHVKITDTDTGEILLNKKNAVHPQNIARVIARALSNENNYAIHRIAFGNGGTVINAALQLKYHTPNDGQDPDPEGWASRLYNETYSEIIDESSSLFGTGEGAVPSGDTPFVEHLSGPGVRSIELDIISEVKITVVLNPGEPTGQLTTDDQGPFENPESDFTFDEIGLFTSGSPHVATSGYQNVNVSDKTASDFTGLATSTTYSFDIDVNSAGSQFIQIVTPSTGSGEDGNITFSDIIPLINTQLQNATCEISDGGLIQTYGFLKFTSNTPGGLSTVNINIPLTPSPNHLFSQLSGFFEVVLAIDGAEAGEKNNPVESFKERERLLTHIIFSPVLKSANRSLTITYTITVAVARST